MEIEVGDYVRTYNKGIKKIERINNNKTVNKYLYFTGVEDFEGKEYAYIKTTEVVKHSKNIIDLIEEGDFVNGHKFVGKVKLGTHEMLEVEAQAFNGKCFIEFNEVETILTHEQYESNCYRVER